MDMAVLRQLVILGALAPINASGPGSLLKPKVLRKTRVHSMNIAVAGHNPRSIRPASGAPLRSKQRDPGGKFVGGRHVFCAHA